MVTNGMWVRSRSGIRGLRTASSAARSTSAGNSGVTPISCWMEAMPARNVSPSACSTFTTRLGTPRHPSMSAQVVGSRQHRVTRVLILLPPSEGKTPPRRGKPLDLGSLSFPGLAPHRSEVLDALVGLCSTDRPAEAAQVLGLGRTQEDVVASNARLREASTGRADRVYSGVLYEALDVAGLQGASRRRATTWLAVTSGLF